MDDSLVRQSSTKIPTAAMSLASEAVFSDQQSSAEYLRQQCHNQRSTVKLHQTQPAHFKTRCFFRRRRDTALSEILEIVRQRPPRTSKHISTSLDHIAHNSDAAVDADSLPIPYTMTNRASIKHASLLPSENRLWFSRNLLYRKELLPCTR